MGYFMIFPYPISISMFCWYDPIRSSSQPTASPSCTIGIALDDLWQRGRVLPVRLIMDRSRTTHDDTYKKIGKWSPAKIVVNDCKWLFYLFDSVWELLNLRIYGGVVSPKSRAMGEGGGDRCSFQPKDRWKKVPFIDWSWSSGQGLTHCFNIDMVSS